MTQSAPAARNRAWTARTASGVSMSTFADHSGWFRSNPSASSSVASPPSRMRVSKRVRLRSGSSLPGAGEADKIIGMTLRMAD